MSQSPKERMPEEDDTTEAPLTMAASVVLTNLPKDASKALETAGSLAVQKGILDCFSISSILWDGDPPAIPPSSQLSFPISFHPTYISLFSGPTPQLHTTNHPPLFSQ